MNTPDISFRDFGKMARLSREVIITEKIDGTNAQVGIFDITDVPPMDDNRDFCLDTFTSAGRIFGIFAGSRTRWLKPGKLEDNYGFAGWVRENADALTTLGPGRHFGEWWGCGINRNYGRSDRRLSLFNVSRFCLHGETPKVISAANPKAEAKFQLVLPPCVGLVPVLYTGVMDTACVERVCMILASEGSKASPGFMNPEGVVVYHTAAGVCFKKTLVDDYKPKSLA